LDPSVDVPFFLKTEADPSVELLNFWYNSKAYVMGRFGSKTN
jgi:hypothetical protein